MVAVGSALGQPAPWPFHGGVAPQVQYFPPTNVMNVVTDPAIGAKGDGKTDDTAALQRALNTSVQYQLVYFPAGTYLISGPLACPTYHNGVSSRHILQGENPTSTTIVLADKAEGFGNASSPLAMLECGHGVAQSFDNHIMGLAFNSGRGNPGAIGIRFQANNMGSIRDVAVFSGDGQGVAALDMTYSDQIGPLLVDSFWSRGFGYGFMTGHNVDSQTMEHALIESPTTACVANFGQVFSLRDLRCRATSTATGALMHSLGGYNVAFFTLIDASIEYDPAYDHSAAYAGDPFGRSGRGVPSLPLPLEPTSGPTPNATFPAAINGSYGMWHIRNASSSGFELALHAGAYQTGGQPNREGAAVHASGRAERATPSELGGFMQVTSLPGGVPISEWVSHPVLRLFHDAATPNVSLGLPVADNPLIPLDTNASRWISGVGSPVNVSHEGGPSGLLYNCTLHETRRGNTSDKWWVPDCSHLLKDQLLRNPGASTVNFPQSPHTPGTWIFYEDVSIPATISRMIMSGSQVGGEAALVVDSGDASTPPLLFERWYTGYNGGLTVRHSSRRPIILQDVEGIKYEADCSSGGTPGDVFISDVVNSNMTFCRGQKVWARQLNIETPNLAVAAQGEGTDVWVLGLKLERGTGGYGHATDGAQLEVLGTFAYTTTHPQQYDVPLFAAARGGRLSASLREYNADCNPAMYPAAEDRLYPNGTTVSRTLGRNFSYPGLIPGHTNSACPSDYSSGYTLFVAYHDD